MSKQDNHKTLFESSMTRREFSGTTLAALGGLAVTTLGARSAMASEGDEIRVGLVGSGGRGTGAALNALYASDKVRLVAVGDAFQQQVDGAFAHFEDPEYAAQVDPVRDRIDVPPERRYVGLDAYRKVIEHCDVVILATPPAFRPQHFEAAVAADKHVFMEKPVATDAPGVRRVLAAGEAAKQKQLNVVVGLQRHYERKYTEWVDQLKAGIIGDIVVSRVYWNSGGVWDPRLAREDAVSELQYQVGNWYYYTWACGDHNVEQHIHNIDVGNWVHGGYPVKCQGQGGRQVRTDPKYGQIFDHHYVEYEFENGARMISQCNHFGGANRVSEAFHGTAGSAPRPGMILDAGGEPLYRFREKENEANPYQYEHDVLFDAIAKGEYRHADTANAAYATLTAIMGRMATYSGQEVSWDEALNSEIRLAPDFSSWDEEAPVQPNADGSYPVAMPGKTLSV
jgi:predicted dehydrogenase